MIRLNINGFKFLVCFIYVIILSNFEINIVLDKSEYTFISNYTFILIDLKRFLINNISFTSSYIATYSTFVVLNATQGVSCDFHNIRLSFTRII
jgi:hypothetical protein